MNATLRNQFSAALNDHRRARAAHRRLAREVEAATRTLTPTAERTPPQRRFRLRRATA
jgi:hypothetical protein